MSDKNCRPKFFDRVPAVVIGHLRETEFLDKKNTLQTKTKIIQ